jgi:hypothetical protein
MVCANPSRRLADAAIGLSETVFDPVHGRFFFHDQDASLDKLSRAKLRIAGHPEHDRSWLRTGGIGLSGSKVSSQLPPGIRKAMLQHAECLGTECSPNRLNVVGHREPFFLDRLDVSLSDQAAGRMGDLMGSELAISRRFENDCRKPDTNDFCLTRMAAAIAGNGCPDRVEDCAQNRQSWGREVRSTDEVALCLDG